MPYIVYLIIVRGLIDAVGYPDDPKPISAWATRMKAALSNAVENLVVFAALILIASAAGISNQMTENACVVYFWARLVHLAAYTVLIPWVKTFAFLTGFSAKTDVLIDGASITAVEPEPAGWPSSVLGIQPSTT